MLDDTYALNTLTRINKGIKEGSFNKIKELITVK